MPTHSGGVAVGDHLVDERLELVEGLGDLVALLPSQTLGTYQTSDLRSDLTGTPYWVPSTLA